MISVYTPDAVYDDGGEIERRVMGDAIELTIEKWRDQDSIDTDALAMADGLLVWQMVNLDDATLGRLNRCRIIVRCGVGYNNIDTNAAAARNIPVCNTPDYGTCEVADHTVMMLLALEHGLTAFDRALRHSIVDGFDHRLFLQCHRISGRIMGMVGLGAICTAVALRAKALGMNVLVYDPFLPSGQERALGVVRAESLDELFATADVVSLHAPLTAQTENMINADAMARIKPGVVILNTARGGLVDLDALYDGLRSGQVRAAALDVLPVEPPSVPLPRLLEAFTSQAEWLEGRLIITPHAAWSSLESRDDSRIKSTETMRRFLTTGELRNCVNMSMLAPDWRERREHTLRIGA